MLVWFEAPEGTRPPAPHRRPRHRRDGPESRSRGRVLRDATPSGAWRALTAGAALTAALALLTTGCGNPGVESGGSTPQHSGPSAATGAATAQPAARAIQWVIDVGSLQHLANAGMSDAELRRLFDNRSTYVIQRPHGGYDTSGWVAHRVLKFEDEAVMARTLAAGVPAGIDTVLLDLEKWSLTPSVQQQYPGYFYERGAAVARQRRVTYLVTPGTDLAQVLAPQAPGPPYQTILNHYVDGFAARGAGMIGIQAQSLESNPGAYVDYVRRAAAQAQANQPGIRVFGGLSAFPDGYAASPADFAACIRGARPYVSGYLLWVPSTNAGMVAGALRSLG